MKGSNTFLYGKKIEPVIVNNSIYINKTNNHTSHQTFEHTEITTTYGIRNPDSDLGQVQTCDEIHHIIQEITLSTDAGMIYFIISS